MTTHVKPLVVFLCLWLIATACSYTLSPVKTPRNYQTQHPILLVHGFAFRDDLRLKRYWGNIPEVLEKNGVEVYLSHHNAFGSHQASARQIKARLQAILDSTGHEKVNIIAHSKGGIEARYLISRLGMAPKVASLTTLGTPHRGANLANIIMGKLIDYQALPPLQRMVTKAATLLGDIDPDPLMGGFQLTPEYMARFNQAVPNDPRVYYQSFAGKISADYPSLLQRIKYKELIQREGPHDGTVSVASARWGEFRGIIPSGDAYGVSHFEMIGQSHVTAFDAPAFFLQVVADLKQKGY